MGKLTEYLKAEANTIRQRRTERRLQLEEWLDILNDLYTRIDRWLDASDPDKLLERSAPEIEAWDGTLGTYRAPTRRITVEDRTVEIVPKTRLSRWSILLPGSNSVVQGHGLVELRSPGASTVYLFQRHPKDWFIKTDAGDLSVPANKVEPLDAERFEAALAGMLG